MPARLGVEQIVRGDAQHQPLHPGQRLPAGREIDHHEAPRRRFERGDAALRRRPFDLGAGIETRRVGAYPAQQAQRRDTRHRPAAGEGRLGIIDQHIAAQRPAHQPPNGEPRLRFHPPIARGGGGEGEHRQALHQGAGLRREDIAAEASVVSGEAHAPPAPLPARDRLDRPAAFDAERGVADQLPLRSRVDALG